jgi:hypothetical protein
MISIHHNTKYLAENNKNNSPNQLNIIYHRDGPTRSSDSSEIVTLNSSTNDETLNNSETTKSELIKCILDSFKSKPSPCQSLNTSNKIYIHFNEKNELGINPHIDDLLEQIEYTKKCSCHRLEIIFDNYILNQQLSYKQKQSILRLILRRQQISNRFYLLTQSNI